MKKNDTLPARIVCVAMCKLLMFSIGREEATRTPDPHVPNVVRYQLRYFSNAFTISYNLTILANSQ